MNNVEEVMSCKDIHVIQGKWVDCKTAVPVAEMKEAQAQLRLQKERDQ
jgi:hypothetical protein